MPPMTDPTSSFPEPAPSAGEPRSSAQPAAECPPGDASGAPEGNHSAAGLSAPAPPPTPGGLTPASHASPAPNVAPAPPAVSDADPFGPAEIKRVFDRITAEIAKIYVGQDELVLSALIALFSGGHVLIESVPGLGKTLFVRTLGRVLGCQFGRIQFTADLMPSDITGAPIFDMKTQEFRFRPGPVFTQLLLADEINRSPAKTHAALLEIMQEYRVTVERTGHKLKRPFLVLATQNPIESEGTYNLPEAQLDRFMFKITAEYPSATEENEILKLHSQPTDIDARLALELSPQTSPEEILRVSERCGKVHADERLIDYVSRIVRRTREWPQFHMGASPRAGLALVQGARTLAAFRGRDFVVPDDVVEIALPALRHRVILTAEAEVEGRKVDESLSELIRSVEVTRR